MKEETVLYGEVCGGVAREGVGEEGAALLACSVTLETAVEEGE